MIANTRCRGRQNAISEPHAGLDEEKWHHSPDRFFGVPGLGDDAEKFGATGCYWDFE
jgi:hypothetical protein